MLLGCVPQGSEAGWQGEDMAGTIRGPSDSHPTGEMGLWRTGQAEEGLQAREEMRPSSSSQRPGGGWGSLAAGTP